MDRIQIAISDEGYCAALRRALAACSAGDVVCVDEPDTALPGVLVVDLEHLMRLALPLKWPERFVLVSHDDPSGRDRTLDRAWQAGVRSVVSDRDPVNTAALAVISARLRGLSHSLHSKEAT